VIKSVSEIDREERCEACDSPAARQFVPSRVYFSGASVQDAEYNPGLGCVVKNKHERQEIAKRKGLVELGNDYKNPDSLHKEYEQKRAAKRAAAWEKDDL
jgi:hypothetical protein